MIVSLTSWTRRLRPTNLLEKKNVIGEYKKYSDGAKEMAQSICCSSMRMWGDIQQPHAKLGMMGWVESGGSIELVSRFSGSPCLK